MAFSIITWDRLEPLDQTSDLRVALGAPIADPLWLLHRQWQLGELDGNDAGTPIAVTVADGGDAAVALPRRRRARRRLVAGRHRRSSRSSRPSGCAACPSSTAAWPPRRAPSSCAC